MEEVNDPAPEAEASRSHQAPTIFLSYASEDREAARVLRDALPTLGLEVWYDESDLGAEYDGDLEALTAEDHRTGAAEDHGPGSLPREDGAQR